MGKNIRSVIRFARSVAIAVARVVDNDMRFGRPPLATPDTTSSRLPVELTEPDLKQDGPQAEVEFRFEGGTVVTVFLYDVATLCGSRQADWSAYRTEARYWLLDESSEHIGDAKTEHTFQAEELEQIRGSGCGWHYPEVFAVENLTASVGIFWDANARRGYVEAHQASDEQGSYTLVASVVYMVLVPGDQDRALTEARETLARYYAGEVPAALTV